MPTFIQRSLLASVTACALALPASAQYWEVATPFYWGVPSVCYTDTVHDQLLMASQLNMYVDSLHAYWPLFRYDGANWDTLGLFGNAVYSAVTYHDTLIVSGGFQWMQNDSIGGIACFVNGQWHSYGNVQAHAPEGNYHGPVFRLRVVEGELYAMGVFRYADGQQCNGLAKRVGGHWEPVPGWAQLDFMGDPWVRDIIRFQDRLVVCGNFNFNVGGPWWKDILQYDGTAWGPVCDHCLQGGYDMVTNMAVYKDELYVGGGFYYDSGNAGQGIMRWDGETWRSLGPVGGGLQVYNYSDQYTPGVGGMIVLDGLLYIGGGFRYVEHMPVAAAICTWDGMNFCIPDGPYFSDYFAPFTFYHGTPYGSTASNAPIELRGLVRYTGTFDQCSTLGIAGHGPAPEPLRAAWSPSEGLVLHGLADGLHQVQVFDAQGRLVLDTRVHSASGRSEGIALQGEGAALYMVVVDHCQATKLAAIR